MNSILIRMAMGALIQSVKNPKKKAELRAIAREVVQGLLLAYADDPDFLVEDEAE